MILSDLKQMKSSLHQTKIFFASIATQEKITKIIRENGKGITQKIK